MTEDVTGASNMIFLWYHRMFLVLIKKMRTIHAMEFLQILHTVKTFRYDIQKCFSLSEVLLDNDSTKS